MPADAGVSPLWFARLGERGAETPVVGVDGDDGVAIYDLGSLTADLDGAFWAGDGVDRAAAALAAGQLTPVPGSLDDDARSWGGQRFGAAIARPPAIICIGMNYAAHAAEGGAEPPTTPVVFFKHPNTLCGPNDDLVLPPGATKMDWEVELGVVIGRRASYLASVDEALDHVAGYVVSHDVSERAFQIEQSGGQWSKGKCCADFNPVGGRFVPGYAVADPQALRLRSFVNGGRRQDSSTADMIFSVAYILWHLSQYMVLEPGDLVNTGTPEGVALSGRFAYLAVGDRVRCEVDGLGATEQVVVAGGPCGWVPT